jgi:hypothetical protein
MPGSGRREGGEASRQATMDGPFTKAGEMVGAYWGRLSPAASTRRQRIVAENPCLGHGLVREVRRIAPLRASICAPASETPT